MNIAVLVKQVPSVSDIELDPKTNNLVRIGAPSMLNPHPNFHGDGYRS